MDWLKKLGGFLGGVSNQAGRTIGNVIGGANQAVQQAQRTFAQPVQRVINQFVPPPRPQPPRPQLPKVQIPRFQAPPVPRVDLNAVNRALGNYYNKTALKTGVDNINDVFNANSAADIQKRLAAGQPADYRTQQIQQGNLRPYQNVGAALFGNTARYLNTAAAASKELQDTINIGILQGLGQQRLANRSMNQNAKFKQQMYQPNSGLFGQGTIFNRPEEFGKVGAGELSKRVALNTLGTAFEIAPLSKGAGLGANATYKALSKPAQLAVRTAVGAAEGAAQDVAEQQFIYNRFRPEQTLAAAAFGGVLPNVGPALSRIKGLASSKAASNLPGLPVSRPLTMPSQRPPSMYAKGSIGSDVPESAMRPKAPQVGKTYKVYRGSGDGKQIKTQYNLSILGNDKKYYAFDKETAGKFGKNVESTNININKPLEITNDTQWREISKNAGNKYPLATGLSKVETQVWIANVNKYIKSQGYDGVIVKMNKGADSSLIKDVFETDQIVPFNNLRPSSAPQVGKTAPIQASVAPKVPVKAVGVKNRGLIESIKSSPRTNQKIAANLADMPYDVLPNPKTLQNAVNTINKNPQGALNEVLSSKPRTTQLNAQGLILAEKAQQHGDYDLAQNIFKAMAPGNTTAGQTIQILSVWSKTTPKGVVRYAQKVVDDANNVIIIDGGNPTITLSAEKAKAFRTMAEKIQKLPEGRDKLIQTQQMLNAIHQQVPATVGSKLQSVLYYAQLLNPKTAGRNIIGNTGMVVQENVKDVIGAPLDFALTGFRRLAGNKTVKRSVYLPSLVGQAKAALKGSKDALQEAKAGVNLSGQSGQLQIGNVQPAFTGRVGQGLNKAMQIELSVPDRAFYNARHFQTLKNEMRAAGVTKPTKDMLDRADFDALYATFQDDSRAAQAFMAIKKGLNKAGTKNGDFGLGSFVLNYPKTPGNLLSRGIGYSPAGYARSLVEIAKPVFRRGPFNQKAFVDSFSRATTGTVGLIGTGALLYEAGIITGAPSKDKDVNAADKNTGLGAYRLNASALKRYITSGFNPESGKLQNGDKLVSYDWLQPAAIGLAMGANLSETKGTDKGAIGKLSAMFGSAGVSVAAGAQTIFEQPLIKGLVALTGRGAGLAEGLIATAVGIPASFVPAILNQINQATDNTARSTYDPNPLNQSVNQVKAKIPFLSKELQPQVGPMGENNVRYQDGNNLFNVFLNPAFTSTYDAISVDKEIKRLEDTTGQTSQYPAIIKNTQTVDGKDVKLSAQQVTDVQRMQGTLTKGAFNGIMADPGYAKLSDTDKVKKLQNIITEANQIARIKVLGDPIDKQTKGTVQQGVESGQVSYNTLATGQKKPAKIKIGARGKLPKARSGRITKGRTARATTTKAPRFRKITIAKGPRVRKAKQASFAKFRPTKSARKTIKIKA